VALKTNREYTQDDFKRFSRQFKAVRSAKSEKRTQAVGTLTPTLLRKHLKSGKDLVLDYGRQGLTVQYSLQDLQKFAKEADAAAKKFGKDTKGVPALQLVSASQSIDLARANNRVKDGSGIRTAVLYAVRGDETHFRVNASDRSEHRHHQVRIRLEEWNSAVTGIEAPLPAARRVAKGRISFDCDCGRHQYWYRYIATIGGFALRPFEHAFPKIRNPKLRGACCKHVLKCISMLQSPSVQGILAKKLEEQSAAVSFTGDPKRVAKYLKKDEVKKTERARKQFEEQEAQKEWQLYKKAQEAFARKASSKATKDAQERLREANKKAMRAKMERAVAEKVAKREIEERRRLQTQVRNQWTGILKTLAATGAPLETMIDNLVKNTPGASKDDLMQIAKDEGLL